MNVVVFLKTKAVGNFQHSHVGSSEATVPIKMTVSVAWPFVQRCQRDLSVSTPPGMQSLRSEDCYKKIKLTGVLVSHLPAWI